MAAPGRSTLRPYTRHALRPGAELTQDVRTHREEVYRLNQVPKLCNRILRRGVGQLSRAQMEAAEARQLKEQFASTVSHELRTSLEIIVGFVDVM